jgi:hypothetical protein
MAFSPFYVAQQGRKIYDRRRRDLEAEKPGWFAAIDVATERMFLEESLEKLYRVIQREQVAGRATGPFHFVRIGHRGVYRSTRPPWRRRAAG